MAFLTVKDLSLHYSTSRGAVRAVDSVSFEIPSPGEVIGVIGETGSGKSSLLMALTRVLASNISYYAGQILLQDINIMDLTNEEYRRQIRWSKIAVVFQGAMNGFNPVMRVGHQLIERILVDRLKAKEEARSDMEKLLVEVGLPADTFQRYPHELSGGMRQRAAIAMALSLNPDLVLLDEPTSALDVSVQAQIMNVLKRLKWDRNLSMIFITHDIALASDLSDRLAVMYGGQIREIGSAENVLNSPQDLYTQELLASIPRLHGEESPHFVAGVPPDPVSPPLGCRFYDRCPKAFDKCRTGSPELVQSKNGQMARCWLIHQEKSSE